MKNEDNKLGNDDEQQLAARKIEDWMDEHSMQAVELYFAYVSKNCVDVFYVKHYDDIFAYLSDHPEEMR